MTRQERFDRLAAAYLDARDPDARSLARTALLAFVAREAAAGRVRVLEEAPAADDVTVPRDALREMACSHVRLHPRAVVEIRRDGRADVLTVVGRVL